MRLQMTDREIIQGLLARDNQLTEEFFFVRCHPLFQSIMQHVFSYEVDYNEMVNELYAYLMEEDGSKLRNFQYRSSLFLWLKVLAIRYFIKKRNKMIDDTSHEALYYRAMQKATFPENRFARGDIERLFEKMPNKRYAYVIRRIVIEGCEAEQLALEMNITTANLYNIKKRAMAQLTRTALKDIKEYEK